MDVFAGSRILGFLPSVTGSRAGRPAARMAVLAACAVVPVLSALYPKWQLVYGRDPLFIRPEDPVVLLLLLMTIARGRWRPTALDLRVLLFLLACSLSIITGFVVGTMQRPVFSLLYLFKLIEYFAIGYIALNWIDSEDDARGLLRVIVYTVTAVAVFGVVESAAPYAYSRYDSNFVYRAYERGLYDRDANHMAAFLMLGSAVALGLGSRVRGPCGRAALLGAGVIALVAIAFTYSRGAYLACGLATLVVVLMSPFRIRALAVMAGLVVMAVIFAPADMMRRAESIAWAWLGQEHSMGIRAAHYQLALQTFANHPLLGVGLAAEARVFYENTYMMLLAETGVLGFGAFGLIMSALAWAAIDLYRTSTVPWVRGFAAGYLAGLTGLLVLGCTLVVFVLSRVAPTFWLLSGVLLWLRSVRVTGD